MSTDAINHMNYFWQNMSTLLGETFKEYQDSYYFEKFVLKGMNKAGMTVAKIRNAQRKHENGDDEVSGVEYMTAITSYMFAILPQAMENFTVGKGDVVPFLYYKMNTEETNPKELARYAYVPLIEGWCTSVVGTNLWETEYRKLFGEYDENELSEDLDTLQEWYDIIYDKYKNDKGKKGNNLLGCDITTIIQSDYSVSDQLEATEVYLDNVFNELGLERSYKENIARNQMMAEYMMQDSGLDNTIEDYNVSIKFTTENLQRGTFEPKNSHTEVLSDYQMIKLNHTLDLDGHSDNDGISDLHELGAIKWMDITSFVEKTYNNMKAKGEPCKNSLIEQIEDIVNKQGGNYLEKRWGHVKVEGTGDNMRVYYRTYDYTSNPVLDDTDFDGIRDDQDSNKLNGTFTGTSTDIGHVEYNNDFRWFFTKNSKYNDELAVMSLIASNLANSKTISTDQVSGNITQYLSKLGFTDIRNISDNGEVYVGKKTITYYGVTKNIYSIVVGERNLENNYYAMLMKNKETNGVVNASYVDYGKTIEELAKSLCPQIFNDNNFSANTYWITGYGLAGSIASEIAARFSDGGGEVFCYTFGAINTGKGRKGTYLNIKNVINEDDYIPKMMNKKIFTKPGQIYSSSIKEDLLREYRDIIGNTNYKGDYYLSNFISKIFEERKNGISNEMYEKLAREWSRHLEHYSNMSSELQTNGETSDMAIAINNMSRATEDAHSMKSYYVLAKSLNGFDLTDGDGEKIERYQYVPDAMLVSFNQTEIVTKEIDTSFADAYMMGIRSIEKINFNHQGKRHIDKNDWCYKLTGKNEFMYTNYTLPDNIVSYDISYSQFWDDKKDDIANRIDMNKESSHYLLYKNSAGDFSSDTTKIAFGRYHKGTKIENGVIQKKDERTEKIDRYGEKHTTLYNDNGYKCELYTVDGRIVAAMPLHLLLGLVNGKEDGSIIKDLYENEMDKNTNYGGGIGIGKYTETGKVNNTSYTNKQYKYIDIVMESNDGYQYVIPIMVVDVKWLHNEPYADGSNKHFATLTDNTYGHVYENEIINNIHDYVYMNPIEPYIKLMHNDKIFNEDVTEYLKRQGDYEKNKGITSDVNNKLQDLLFGTDKIISMRLYDKQFSESDSNWWKKKMEGMQKYTIEEYKTGIENEDLKFHNGIIINY